jgi:enediyne biosynthesis thioesterase
VSGRPFVQRRLVTYEETNALGNVYFVNYLRWQGAAREAFIHEHAPDVLAQVAAGLRLVTVRCSCDYYQELAAFDEIDVRMFLDAQQQNRLSLAFEYVRVSGGEPELVARGAQDVAFLRVVHGRSEAVAPPAALMRAMRQFAPQLVH